MTCFINCFFVSFTVSFGAETIIASTGLVDRTFAAISFLGSRSTLAKDAEGCPSNLLSSVPSATSKLSLTSY